MSSKEFAFYFEQYARELLARREAGLSAVVYGQYADLGQDLTGLMSFDRENLKIDLDRIQRANSGAPPRIVTLVNSSVGGGEHWDYQLEAPGGDWTSKFGPDLDLPGEGSPWLPGAGSFGEPSSSVQGVSTPWETSDIWLKCDFRWNRSIDGELLVPMRLIGEVKIWLNGSLLYENSGEHRELRYTLTGQRAEALLRQGINRLAIHCQRTAPEQLVDVGLQIIHQP